MLKNTRRALSLAGIAGFAAALLPAAAIAQAPTKGVKLGVFSFAAGEKGHVEIRNDGTDGHVVADAVQFVAE